MNRRPRAQSGSTPAKVRRRLLVVEDERIVALDLRGALEDLGYEVVGTAASSEDALRAVEKERPDLVLMDIRLEGRTDGIQTAAALRSQYQIPVVYLTANADAATLDRALDTQPGGYIAKPYNHATLRTTIEVALRREESERALRREHSLERRQLQERAAELTELAERFRVDSTTDPLTGLYNRRQLEVVLEQQISLARREGHAVGVILLDLDRFKTLNDTFGHVAADSALRAVADFLRSRVRGYDVACRYGGEEMVIVVPGAQVQDTLALAEKLRSGLEELVVEHAGRRLGQITASFGVASFPTHGSDPRAIVEAADAALYRAKDKGRNCVVSASIPEA